MIDPTERTFPTDWEAPLPLEAATPPSAFPIEHLPAWLANFVHRTAEATQVPLDAAGMLALAEVSVALVLPSGERKTGALEAMNQPLCSTIGSSARFGASRATAPSASDSG